MAKLNSPLDVVNRLNEMIKSIDEAKGKRQRFVERLGEECENIVRVNLVPINDTGELEASLKQDVGENVVVVSVNTDYAIFVEFGTGSVGENNPVNVPLPNGYVYGAGKCQFRDDEGNAKGWVYYNDKLGRYVFTEGMAGRPFMHMSAEELRRKVEAIAREVFG